ncbi:MAG: Pyridine nucleotide-disulfide oxidoreductase, FAD/NAD(P)-binding domain protein, partial [Gemmatimonadetes bacterium]|nr:Pyridine nucleotide-disulfide oxidoreductase, FAD/NAD(P)-binding domain protein [Gemmatimonadota bacterium]
MTDNLSGPDFTLGVPFTDVAEGAMLAGHANGKAVLVARQGSDIFAIGATCTHYGGPLGDGLLVGDTVRCPWHHACFSLRTGEPLRAPALKPVARWEVEQRDGRIFVSREIEPDELIAERKTIDAARVPKSVVIVGAGAAGNAAAEMLRREGYEGPVMMISVEDSVPYDRPNLSKDYLAGNAPEEWIPLRTPEFYAQHAIELVLGRRVTEIDVKGKRVVLDDGSAREFDALLLATGAEPIHLPTPASAGSGVFYLRSLNDSRAIIAATSGAKSVVVIGGSFIGLEAAASLRNRGLDVHVVAPESRPLEKILGAELGDFVRALHEKKGIMFHLGHTVKQIDAGSVTLDDGTTIKADFVVIGVGVRPRDELASKAGLAMDKGVIVDEYLETSAPGIYAAGDIARYPDAISGARIRVEHWVVAERQGQVAAKNILGQGVRFDHAPFFWSQHYDQAISYVGHAEKWDAVEIDGSVVDGDCVVRYVAGGKVLAVATVAR